MRIILISILAAALAVVAVLGLRGSASRRPPLQVFDDMVDQPRYANQGASRFFADGRQMRLPPPGAIAYGRSAALADESLVLAGDEAVFSSVEVPAGMRVDRVLLDRGREQFDVFCAVCHGRTGDGKGITTQYNMIAPPSYHGDRLRQMPAGEIFKIITQGKGLMAPYGTNVRPNDRWAIVAYVRVLQRAYRGVPADVPAQSKETMGQ